MACLLNRVAVGALPLTTSLLLASWPQAPAGAQPAPLDARVAALVEKLKAAWAADPATASQPFPSIDLLPEGQSVASACRSTEATPGPERPGRYCPTSGSLLLDQTLLTRMLEKAKTTNLMEDWLISYWIGVALAERLLASTASPSQASANLQANCLAGVLIGAAPALTPPESADYRLLPALVAYTTSQAERMGTRSQRGYAFLTGFGATESSCSKSDMQALAMDRVRDPAVLEEIVKIPLLLRAKSDLARALNSSCRPKPSAPCPRRIPSLTAQAVKPQGILRKVP